MDDILFISDLHLKPSEPETMDLFIRFSDEIASQVDTLYILGDFLEYWLGDDDPAEAYADVFDCLSKLSEDSGTRVYLMHGNRDFLIGSRLAERCGFEIIKDPHKIKIQGKDALLMHGDTLCTDDVDYQKFRQMVRNPEWQQQVLSRSLEERYQLAQSLRQDSQQAMADKAEYIMDVNEQETQGTFEEHDVDLIIHGHTHRPAIHREMLGDRETTRVVLGDWHDTASYLRVNDDSELRLQNFS
jgi:UDP-2,3-diacylglucosamine hydrolase